MLYWALLFIPASTTMVIGALVPIITFCLAWMHGQESFRWRGLLGGVIAFLGIFFAIGNEIGSSLPLIPVLAVLLGFSATAEGTVLYKSFPKTNPIVVNAVSLTTGTIILLLVSLLAGENWTLPGEPNTWLAYGYLVIGGSVALFYFVLYILDRWTASATSYAFLLFPIATIVIASWLADEVITGRFLMGAGVVLVGVWFGAIANPQRNESTAS
jgi:drug/metabolite transporter (DMT)-like permease